MQAPPPSQSPVPDTPPPGIIEQASQDVVNRLDKHQNVYKVGESAYRIVDEVAEAVYDKNKDREDLSRELEEATDSRSYEQAQPVIDRRKERSRDKRGR